VTKIAGVTPRGMQMLYQQVRKCASNDNIENLLLYLKPLARPGAPVNIALGTIVSRQIH